MGQLGTNLPIFPAEASTYAAREDTLMLALVLLAAAITLGVAGSMFFFLIKYRRRPGNLVATQVRGNTRIEVAWIVIPILLSLVAFGWGAATYLYAQEPPSSAIQINVVAKQWMWKFQYPTGQEEIDSLHVPVGEPVRLMMTSQDVIHSFYVPNFRVKADVLPDRYTTTWFQATQPGAYHIFCSQFCGSNHSEMTGWVYVMSPADYQNWLTQGAMLSPSAQGAQLFLKLGCESCHRNDSLRRAPVLEGLYGQPVRLEDGSTVIADDAYIRDSILDPTKQIVQGYQPIMPSFRGQVSEEDIFNLIAYIKQIGNTQPGPPPLHDQSGPAPTPPPRGGAPGTPGPTPAGAIATPPAISTTGPNGALGGAGSTSRPTSVATGAAGR